MTARSSRPSLSKSSMTAPPAMLNRSTPTSWPMSRNLPMSNSDLTESVERDQVPGIDLLGVFAQGHVGQVQEPADPQVVGELLEILGEMLDRQPGTGGIGVDGGRRDGEDARALAAAHDAIFGLAAPQRSDPLEGR